MGKRKARAQDTTSSTQSQSPSLNTYQKYTYLPLLSPQTSIRLLTLRPAPDAGWPLRCSLIHTPLSTAPPYTALSYTWGDATRSTLILIDNDHVSITYNLKHALQRLRLPDRDVVLWVDAVCINQDDVAERSILTTRMRSVYVHAESVAVWLGNSHGFSHGAVQIVRELNACVLADDIRALISGPERREQLEALVMLFRRQYWWRIWVIQEVSCAAHAIVYIGEEAIPWTELDGVCSVLREVEGDLHSIFYKSPSWVRTLTHGGPRGLQLSRYNPTIVAPPLLELLLTHKSKKATDPKDKVFALVGISSSRKTFGDVDYARSVCETYVHTAKHIIQSSGKLDVICVKQHDSPQFEGLPSWVPDWTRPKAGSGATVLGLHHRLPAFYAAGDTNAEFAFTEGPRGLGMRVKGLILGTISEAGRPYKKRGAPSFVGPSIDSFLSWWSLFASSVPTVDAEMPSLGEQVRFAHLISCGTWVSEPEERIVEKMSAIFALSEERLSSSEYNIIRLDASSRTSTDTMVSSTSSLRDQDENDIADLENEEDRDRLSAVISAGMMMNRRRMFVCGGDDKVMGLAPWNAELGDEVVVLFGCKFPVVIRRGAVTEIRDVLIGEAYVEGFMSGEATIPLVTGQLTLDEFELY